MMDKDDKDSNPSSKSKGDRRIIQYKNASEATKLDLPEDSSDE